MLEICGSDRLPCSRRCFTHVLAMVQSWPTAVSHMQAMVAGGPQGQRVSRIETARLVAALVLRGGHSFSCSCHVHVMHGLEACCGIGFR